MHIVNYQGLHIVGAKLKRGNDDQLKYSGKLYLKDQHVAQLAEHDDSNRIRVSWVSKDAKQQALPLIKQIQRQYQMIFEREAYVYRQLLKNQIRCDKLRKDYEIISICEFESLDIQEEIAIYEMTVGSHIYYYRLHELSPSKYDEADYYSIWEIGPNGENQHILITK